MSDPNDEFNEPLSKDDKWSLVKLSVAPLLLWALIIFLVVRSCTTP